MADPRRAPERYFQQSEFWESAGKGGYGGSIFASAEVESHILARQNAALIAMAERLGLSKRNTVLELGCGDGKFANQVLSKKFSRVDGMDRSAAAIERANRERNSTNVRFHQQDLLGYRYPAEALWDGAFLVGILHHIKFFAEETVRELSKVCPKVVVLEPNGNNLLRKVLEQFPHYKRSGELSFRYSELLQMFNRNGYRLVASKKINLIPPFVPNWILPALKQVESVVEKSSVFSGACATRILGFEREKPGK